MRGKDENGDTEVDWSRITPAYAGKSFFDDPPESLFEDHPRLCGEKVRQSRTCGSGQGSPPPMRGKVHAARRFDLST